MNTFIDRQLTQIKVQEMLQEAAQARADHKAGASEAKPIAGKLRIALALAIPLVLWVTFIAAR